MRTKPRIDSVRIEHTLDESPDTSYLGEFTDTPSDACILRFGDFAGETIGTLRAHVGEVESVISPEDHSDEPEYIIPGVCKCGGETLPVEGEKGGLHPLYGVTNWECKACKATVPENWFPVRHNREYSLFLPAMTGEESGNPDSPAQDWKRMERLASGDWCYLGIIAKAKIILPSGTVQTIHSGGLWGIESDSDADNIAEEDQNQLADLRTDLLALGIGARAIAHAFARKLEHCDR